MVENSVYCDKHPFAYLWMRFSLHFIRFSLFGPWLLFLDSNKRPHKDMEDRLLAMEDSFNSFKAQKREMQVEEYLRHIMILESKPKLTAPHVLILLQLNLLLKWPPRHLIRNLITLLNLFFTAANTSLQMICVVLL